jgi:uncharacterized membrane protein YfcA
VDTPLRSILIFGATAFFPSVIGAISGIGGGIIIKPILDLVSPLSTEANNFLSGATVLVMAFVSFLRRRLEWAKSESMRRGTALALGAVAGGIAGKISLSLTIAGIGGITGLIQSLMLILLTASVLAYMVKKDHIKPRKPGNCLFAFFLGFVLGLLSSFLGIGGGPFNIMLISYFFNTSIKTTGLYSLYTIFLSQLSNISFSFITGTVPVVPVEVFTAMIAGGIMGGLLGSRIVRSFDKKQADFLFCMVLVLVILISAYNTFEKLHILIKNSSFLYTL